MEKKSLKVILVLIAIVLILIVLSAVLSSLPILQQKEKVKISTDKNEYQQTDLLIVNIGNYLNDKICFSSCYPYYIERQDSGWTSYSYSSCLTANVAEKCINPNDTKAFELAIPNLQKGLHRIAVPVCMGCTAQNAFKEQSWFYSNEFLIK